MISLYFGKPGVGKTTLGCKLLIKAVKSGKWRNVYANFYNTVPGVTVITNDCIGKYDLDDSYIVVDEGSQYAHARNFASFSDKLIKYYTEHRHHRNDIVFLNQTWDGMDKIIRSLTVNVYYVYKPPIRGIWNTYYYRIPYDIIIPDPRKGVGEKLGDIVEGYCKPPLLNRLFAHKIKRKDYYQYFDSWICPKFPPLPPAYVENKGKEEFVKKPITRLTERIKRLYARFFLIGLKRIQINKAPVLRR